MSTVVLPEKLDLKRLMREFSFQFNVGSFRPHREFEKGTDYSVEIKDVLFEENSKYKLAIARWEKTGENSYRRVIESKQWIQIYGNDKMKQLLEAQRNKTDLDPKEGLINMRTNEIDLYKLLLGRDKDCDNTLLAYPAHGADQMKIQSLDGDILKVELYNITGSNRINCKFDLLKKITKSSIQS